MPHDHDAVRFATRGLPAAHHRQDRVGGDALLSGVLRARGVAGWYAAIGSLWLTSSPYARAAAQERLRLSPWIFAFPLRFARGRPLA